MRSGDPPPLEDDSAGGRREARGLGVPALEAITFDFGNTLVPFREAGMARTVELAAAYACSIDGRFSIAEFVRLWREERDRQLREEVPEGREMDMAVRSVRVLARLRGCPAPAPEARWDDEAACRWSTQDEVRAVLDGYVEAFVETTPVPAEIGPLLERLAQRFRLAIVSNWPLTEAIERYLEAAGWRSSLGAVVVSQTAGCIKPRPAIFEAAATALGVVSGAAILHVGDDLEADIHGAQVLGWRTAWIRTRPADSPLPVAAAGDAAGNPATPDLVLDSVLELERAIAPFAHPAGPGGRRPID